MKKKPERRKKKSYWPGVVAVAVAVGVELSGLHNSTYVFVVYTQRYTQHCVYYDEVDNNVSERQRAQ